MVLFEAQMVQCIIYTGAYLGGDWELNPPLDQRKLLISGGFQAPTGAEPPGNKKKLSPPLDKLLNTPQNIHVSLCKTIEKS